MNYWLELATLIFLNVVVFSMALTRIPRAAQHGCGRTDSRTVWQVIAAIEAERRREAAAAGRHRLLAA
ncbi:hypothetical protein [Parasphingorhabdus pacifica]